MTDTTSAAPPLTDHRPLDTTSALLDRFEEFLHRALRRQLWICFLDDDLVQLPLVVPVEDVPVRPRAEPLAGLLDAFEEVGRHVGASRLVVVLERPGPGAARTSDAAWTEAVTSGLEGRSLSLHALLVCSDDGVELLLSPGLEDGPSDAPHV